MNILSYGCSGLSLDVNGGETKAFPGYTLQPFEIESFATSASLALNYQWLQQRRENLLFNLDLDGMKITEDILHTTLTRGRIRALRKSEAANPLKSQGL